MVLPRSALRTLFSAQSRRVTARSATPSRVWQQASRRSYASEGAAHAETAPGSDMPWLIGSIVLTVPAAYYLYQSGPSNAGHGHGPSGHAEHASEEAHVETHAAKPEEAEEKLSKEDLHEEQAQEQETPRAPESEEEKAAPPTTTTDEARETKDVGSFATMSGKQAGLESGDTKHPTIDDEEPKKGDVESARAKGTVQSGEASKENKSA